LEEKAYSIYARASTGARFLFPPFFPQWPQNPYTAQNISPFRENLNPNYISIQRKKRKAPDMDRPCTLRIDKSPAVFYNVIIFMIERMGFGRPADSPKEEIL
jgi:hypothetical protein